MKGITNAEEVMKVLKPVKPAVDLDVNDEVEIVADVLKGSRARVTSVDRDKGVVRVELLDSAFPMPLDLKITEVKLVRKGR
jgi:transcriptional antiterminator NusG